MNEFKIGDTVRSSSADWSGGLVGTVSEAGSWGCLVKFDDETRGHNNDGTPGTGPMWWLASSNLEAVTADKVERLTSRVRATLTAINSMELAGDIMKTVNDKPFNEVVGAISLAFLIISISDRDNKTVEDVLDSMFEKVAKAGPLVEEMFDSVKAHTSFVPQAQAA